MDFIFLINVKTLQDLLDQYRIGSLHFNFNYWNDYYKGTFGV